MHYWFLITQNCVFPGDTGESSYMEPTKMVVVVTKEDSMPSKLLNETNWIGTNENEEGDTKVTILIGWSKLNEKAFTKIKATVDVIWYVEDDKWEWPCMEQEILPHKMNTMNVPQSFIPSSQSYNYQTLPLYGGDPSYVAVAQKFEKKKAKTNAQAKSNNSVSDDLWRCNPCSELPDN